MTYFNGTVRDDLTWALANYLLIKGAHTYFWFGSPGQYGQSIALQEEEELNLGVPLTGIRPFQGGYARQFTRGLDIVNPSPTASLHISLPSHEYETPYDAPFSHGVLPPHSGLILLKR